MSQGWMWNSDHFLIQKSFGVYDIEDVVRAMSLNDSWMDALAWLRTNAKPHDMNDTPEAGVEIDAVDLAVRDGLVSPEVNDILHSGTGHPQYAEAYKQALEMGGRVINAAVEAQNVINAPQGIPEMPVPFDFAPTGEVVVSETWKHGASADRNEIKIPGGKRGGVTPFKHGHLITHIISNATNEGEGYARPYEEALRQLDPKELGFDSVSRFDQSSEGNKRVIEPHKGHRNVVSLFHGNRGMAAFSTINPAFKGASGSGMSEEDALEYAKTAFLDSPAAKHMTHTSHHDPSIAYGGVQEDVELGSPEQAEIQGTAAEPHKGMNLYDIIHPDHKGKNPDEAAPWYKHLQNRWDQYGWNQEYDTPGKHAAAYLQNYHGMDENEASEFLKDIHYNSGKKGRKRSFVDNLFAHHTQKYGAPPKWFKGELPPTPLPPPAPPAVQEEEPPPRPPSPPAPPMDRTLTGNRPPERITVPPPPISGITAPVKLPPNYMKPADVGINDYTAGYAGHNQDSQGGVGRLSQLAAMLARVLKSDEPFSDNSLSEMGSYLEDVQMELAKTTLEDILPPLKLNVENPVDVAIMSSQIQRPTNQILAINHTTGDWRNIAKSFGIKHEQVQFVKVSFNG